MRAVIQRVSKSSVSVDCEIVASIGKGLLVLLGVSGDDDSNDSAYLAEKIVNLRIFKNDQGKMHHSLIDIEGEMLVVSQFTLMADCRKGRRPSFDKAAMPEMGETLYFDFIRRIRTMNIEVKHGCFGAMMSVSLINDGPVTILLDSKAI
ncbi:MAG: D-aminoacyl-tRNA deacylase [Pseudomonadota bacterium]